MSASSHLRLPALALSTTLSLSGLVVLASTAPAAAAAPSPVCTDTTCTVEYSYTGAAESFTVPTAITEFDISVSGAEGGGTRAPLTNLGGEGGTTRATLTAVPGDSLTVLVGGAGSVGGGRTFGGGGGTDSISYTGSGGGGSFVFRPDGTPAVIAGGGGGGAGASGEPDPAPGGPGAGADASGGDGMTIAFYNPSTPAAGGSPTAGGAGGTNRIESNGGAGSGPSTNFAPGAGGDGGHYALWAYYDGAGGGGGYYGGGGGGYADSGAGGSGYAGPGTSLVSSSVGGRTGNGAVTISWTRIAQSVDFTSSAGSPRVGESYQVATTAGDSGNTVVFSSATPDVCTVSGSTVTLHQAQTCTVNATQEGTSSYAPGAATQSVAVSAGDSAVAITSTAPDDAVVGGETYEVVVSSTPSSGAVMLTTSGTDTCMISGNTVSFGDVGECTLTATQSAEANYLSGTDSQTFTVGKGAQSISFTSAVPTGAHPDDTFDLAATGGASSQSVTYGTDTPSVCSVEDVTVTLLSAGTCTVTADQEGDDRYNAAPTAQQDTVATQVASSVALTLPETLPVTGEPVTAQAAVTVDGDGPDGSVQFTVDGDDLGDPVDLVNGDATSPSFDVPAGQHDIGAVYLPTNAARVAEASTSEDLLVEQAQTVTELSTNGQTLRAEVTAAAPGQGTPSGDVTFRVDGEPVGTATLDEGTAELEHELANGSDHGLSAEYAGSDGFLASSDSTSRDDPTITAALTSGIAPSAAGWYRSPVTITYTCTPRGADLVTDCPDPVTVSGDGAAQAFSATVSAADGGVATASSVVNLDRTAPAVRVNGVRDDTAYLGVKPRYSCRAADALSGVASCRITASRRAHGPTVLRATAVDRAGNVATNSVSYWVKRRQLAGATWSNGAWQVQRGRTYTLAAMAGVRPRFVVAVPGSGRPSQVGARLKRSGKAAGVKRWTRSVTMTMPVSRSRIWTLGVKDGRGVHRITVRIVG